MPFLPDRYVAASVARGFVVVGAVFVVLGWLFTLVDEARDLDGVYGIDDAMVYVLLMTPASLAETAPFIALIGALLGMGLLAGRSELTVLRAAGWSVHRLACAALVPVLLLALGLLALGETVAPQTTEAARHFKAARSAGGTGAAARVRGAVVELRRGYWYREGATFVHVGAVTRLGEPARVTTFDYGPRGMLRRVRTAARVLPGDPPSLEAVRSTLPALTRVGSTRRDREPFPTRIDPEVLALEAFADPDDLPFATLDAQVRYLQRQGLDAGPYRLAWWGRVFRPLGVCLLVLLGLAFVFGPLRERSMTLRIGTGVLVGLAYQFARELLGPASLVFGFAPAVAVLLPVLACGIGAFVLLRRAA